MIAISTFNGHQSRVRLVSPGKREIKKGNFGLAVHNGKAWVFLVNEEDAHLFQETKKPRWIQTLDDNVWWAEERLKLSHDDSTFYIRDEHD